MPRKYSFYSRNDQSQESISSTLASGRLAAAKYFAARKRLSLKQFLNIYAISR